MSNLNISLIREQRQHFVRTKLKKYYKRVNRKIKLQRILEAIK